MDTKNDTRPVMLREIHGPLNTLLDRINGKEGRYWLDCLNRFNRKEEVFVEKRIVQFLHIFKLQNKKPPSLTVEEYVKKLNINTDSNLNNRFNFERWFSGELKTSFKNPYVQCCETLVFSLRDSNIIKVIKKDYPDYHVPLYWIFQLIEKQLSGEEGALLTGCEKTKRGDMFGEPNTNVFYVLDADVQRTLIVSWCKKKSVWNITASDFNCWSWGANVRIFFRFSFFEREK